MLDQRNNSESCLTPVNMSLGMKITMKCAVYHIIIIILTPRYECGITKPTASIQDSDREGIISSLCLHYVVLASKAELDDMVEGLKSLGVLSLIRDNPIMARQLFVKHEQPLTAEILFDTFSAADLSPQMSNVRDQEEKQLMNWANFLEFVESMYYRRFLH